MERKGTRSAIRVLDSEALLSPRKTHDGELHLAKTDGEVVSANVAKCYARKTTSAR